jgi:hypothetical protein
LLGAPTLEALGLELKRGQGALSFELNGLPRRSDDLVTEARHLRAQIPERLFGALTLRVVLAHSSLELRHQAPAPGARLGQVALEA